MSVPFGGGGGFGTTPYVPPAQVQPLAGLKPPGSVWAGFVLLVAAGVLSVVNAVVSTFVVYEVAGRTDVLTDYDTTQVASAYVDDVADGVSVGLVVVSVVALACYVLLAFMIKAGRSVPRIICSVLAALSVFGFLGPWPVWLVVILGAAAVVPLWLPTSNAYFEGMRMARMPSSSATAVLPPPPPPGPTAAGPGATSFRF